MFFTADTHFLHAAIIGHCDRPFKNVREMDNILIKNWNESITEKDHIYVLGDFAWGGQDAKSSIERITNKLKGHKHLIYGNHDRLRPFDYIEVGFDSVHTSLEILDGKFLLAHDPAVGSCLKPGQILLHGHIHCQEIDDDRFINVGVDILNFRPIGLSEIDNIFELYKQGER